MASAAPASRGLKRICTGCGTRFYDLEKRPILCPSCGMEFTGDAKLKVRRTRTVAEEAPSRPVEEEEVEKDDIEIAERDADVVGLEDVEEDDGDESDDVDVETDLEELDDLGDDEDIDDEIDVEVEDEADR